MALAVYMDVHVPAAITAGLRRRGINVLRSQDDGTATASDEELLNRATALSRVLFTQDDDLLRIANAHRLAGLDFAGVIYAHQLSAGIGRLVEDLQLVLECCTSDELAGVVTHLPLN